MGKRQNKDQRGFLGDFAVVEWRPCRLMQSPHPGATSRGGMVSAGDERGGRRKHAAEGGFWVRKAVSEKKSPRGFVVALTHKGTPLDPESHLLLLPFAPSVHPPPFICHVDTTSSSRLRIRWASEETT